ncbi:hypothetical protein V6N13_049101 [Hibiscus sabdariffa]|uniref:Uncharacterized protein n=1 Tax=Hibiscus sabdariffa TaxID=183260 RepID=A0ABR2QY87_9ROSI
MAPPLIRSLISSSLDLAPHFHKPISCYSVSLAFFSSSATQRSRSPLPLADHFIEKHNFPPEIAFKAASSLTTVKHPRKCDDIISFLKESGFSKPHIEEAVKRMPNLLSFSLEKTIKPKVKIFREFGFSNNDVVDILVRDPWIFTRSLDARIVPSISYLKSVLGSDADVVKLLKSSTWFVAFDLQKTLMPNIEFLRSCGVSWSQIVSYVFNFPRLLLLKHESIRQYVKRLDDLGFDRNSNMFLIAIRTLSSMSLEHRLKPRIQVIEILESKNLLRRKVSPSTIFRASDKMFREKYVSPYLKELENVSMAISSA